MLANAGPRRHEQPDAAAESSEMGCHLNYSQRNSADAAFRYIIFSMTEDWPSVLFSYALMPVFN